MIRQAAEVQPFPRGSPPQELGEGTPMRLHSTQHPDSLASQFALLHATSLGESGTDWGSWLAL